MSQAYWLDTNAYLLLYQPKCAAVAAQRLVAKLLSGGIIQCSISEITSLELHSVLGKLSRARQSVPISCDRMAIGPSGSQSCPHRWIPPQKARIKQTVLKSLHKLIHDAEQERGTMQVRVHPVPPSAPQRARQLLQKHATRISVGSHDALIAACFEQRQASAAAEVFRLVTSDKGLKKLLELETIPHYDPLTDVEWPAPQSKALIIPASK